MTPYDYAVIVFYFLFMLGMGWLSARFIKNTSDYFRGGGQMLWWLVGSSAFMTQFSAWTFTGAASKAYTEGWPILVIFVGNALGFLFNYLYFSARSRQMRVVTAIEAVRQRFGPANEQVFTWLQIPLGTLYAGIWLNGLCVFVAAAFGFNLETTIILTGAVVVIMTIVGGSWAAVAGDFIQVLILMPVTIVAAFLALRHVGGVGAFAAQLPRGHLDLSTAFNSKIMLLWIVAIFIKQFITTNNLLDSSRYLCVKDSQQARWAGLLGCGLFILGPLVWFIPPMAARIVHPDLSVMFPALKNPAEGAFLAMCVTTMPAGMVGLLLSGIFAATMSSMDSGLNRNAGIFVKSFYHPVLRKGASDRELVLAGKITTTVMGMLVILAGLNFSRLEHVGLFDLMLQFSTLVAIPYTIPLVLCMLVKRTPPWAGWSTVFICLAVSLLTTQYLNPAWAERTFGLAPLDAAARSYWTVGIGLFMNVGIGALWFCGSRILWNSSSVAYRDQVERFFTQMRTPIDFKKEIGEESDSLQAAVLGMLCLYYGGFITLLALIPNPLIGRLGFVFCGGVVLLIGVALRRAARGRRAAVSEKESLVMKVGGETTMTHHGKVILLPPNRVWRTYPGGRTLDELAGVASPADSHLAEDWIASTTRAVNRGREGIAEGVSQVRVGRDPAVRDFAELVASDPEYFLGTAHAKKYGAQPQLLVKFLDSGTRLHFQVHPTREFARRVLGAPSGKTEAYHVLGVRGQNGSSESAGHIYVGFQRPPTPAQLREYIVTQNIAAVEACFDPIPVRPGDTFIIPGGTPHALGAGLFLVEIQEPSDLVVRFEFKRAGYVLPEPARFMNRDVDFALTVFNLAPLTAADLDQRVRCRPRRLREFGPGSWQDELIGQAQTDCFRVAKTTLAGPVTKAEASAAILIVTAGRVTLEVAGTRHMLPTFDRVFLPAGIGPVKFIPEPHAEILECFPPA